jgi:hypothetical protein
MRLHGKEGSADVYSRIKQGIPGSVSTGSGIFFTCLPVNFPVFLYKA